ncbi:hypothetical protein ACWGSK_19910 [Nocardiopsis sp. NPDC055551]
MSWTDYSQNVRIRDLQESLDSAHSQMARERSRMRSELGRLKGGLEQRLDRVSATLDAFIELSDLRVTLTMFDGAAIARHRTLQMIDGSVPRSLELDDVPGYWLAPAARGLHCLLVGDLARARVRFDEAAAIDPERARSFSALAAALTSAEHARALGENTAADLLPHLPVPGTRLTRGQRALWLLSADGSLGEDARERLLLSSLRHWSAQGVRAPKVEAWFATAPSGRGPRSESGLAARSGAARRLSEVRERVTRVTTLSAEDSPTEVLAPDQDSADFLLQTLRLLVEEGSPEEAPLLAEANRLRAVIEGSGEEIVLPSWGENVEEVGTLLQRDLVSEKAPPHRRTFALVLQRGAVLEGAEELAARATESAPDRTSVTLRGTSVTITASGADRGQLEQARKKAEVAATPGGDSRSMLWITMATAGVLLILSLLTMHGFLWFLTLVALGGIGLAYRSTTKERENTEQVRSHELRRIDEQVEKAVREWRENQAEAERNQAMAGEDLKEIRRLLNP